ncbi:unnamed protein product [Linum trigynum]|uniref:Uncharacterized protein n=1 Tax=Linum trigynum TaxID=586398 RepID=A0AAV2DD25_9ROSI
MKLTDEDHEVLKTQITREEIKKVFKSMGKDKAPGLYGYKTEFFTADWDILGTYVENTVLEFLSTWSMPRQDEKDFISRTTVFPLDTLPVKCLGVPLLTGKLSSHDCQVLVDKITARVLRLIEKICNDFL